MMSAGASRSQIKRAGKLLREFWGEELDVDDLPEERQQALGHAYAIVADFRSSYAEPVLKVRMGLQSFLKTTGYPDAHLGQRLKRFPRIMDKLVRYPRMQLTTMQDIGGCRVVLPDLAAVADVARHIQKRWKDQLVEVYDYIANPQTSGYRARHLVVRRDDRLIEIQLRTDRQHRWADAVEQYSRQIGAEMKWGDGEARVHAAFASMADSLADLDEGRQSQLDEILEELMGFTDMIGDQED